jgi:hypothetical protein
MFDLALASCRVRLAAFFSVGCRSDFLKIAPAALERRLWQNMAPDVQVWSG